MTSMTDKTAKAQGYCDRMRGQHLNPFAFDLQPQEFRDFEEMFADEMADGRG